MWATLLLAILPTDPTIYESAPAIEKNHYYDENARLVFTQLIVYDWPDGGHVWFWRMWSDNEGRPKVHLRRDFEGGWRIRFDDGGELREIWTSSFQETWTQHDRELLDREFLPKEKRRPLRHGRHERHHPPPVTAVPLRRDEPAP